MTETSRRNISIDIAKGLGIVLVVFGHNWITQQNDELYRVIFSFHMPLFFFLSGVLLSPEKPFFTVLRQRADSLLKPYVVVLLFLGLRYMIPAHELRADYFIGMLYATGQSVLWTQLWFLPNLFLAQMFALLLLKLNVFRQDMRHIMLLIIAMLLVGVPLMRLGHDYSPMTLEILPGISRYLKGLPWGLDIVTVNTAFLLAGYLSAEHVKNPGKHAHASMLIAGLFFALLHLLYNDSLNIHGRVYDSILVSSIEAFAGIYLLVGLSGLLSQYRQAATLLAYLGTTSLFIFIFHAYFQGKFTIYFQERFPDSPYSGACLGLAAGLIIPILIYEICRRSKLLSAALLPLVRLQPQRKASPAA